MFLTTDYVKKQYVLCADNVKLYIFAIENQLFILCHNC